MKPGYCIRQAHPGSMKIIARDINNKERLLPFDETIIGPFSDWAKAADWCRANTHFTLGLQHSIIYIREP